MAPTLHPCEDCGAQTLRGRTEALWWQLLSPDPDPDGRVAVRVDAMDNVFARTLTDGQLPAGAERLHMPHYATSPDCRDKARQRRAAARAEAARRAQEHERTG